MAKARAVNADTQESPFEIIVRNLSRWKEIITLVTFFSGAGMWIAGYFATKEQVRNLRCFAQESIALTRADLVLRTTFDEVASLSDKIENLERKKKESGLSDDETHELRRNIRDVTDLKARPGEERVSDSRGTAS